jgi:hypothetical protein
MSKDCGGNCKNPMNVECPVCKKPMYLAEMSVKDMTWLCLNCMWVFFSKGFNQKLATLQFEFEPDKSSLEQREMKAINMYKEDVDILARMTKVMSAYGDYLTEKLSKTGFSNPVGHLMSCQMYILQELLGGVIGMLEDRKDGLDAMIDVINKELEQ